MCVCVCSDIFGDMKRRRISLLFYVFRDLRFPKSVPGTSPQMMRKAVVFAYARSLFRLLPPPNSGLSPLVDDKHGMCVNGDESLFNFF
jgi:hypothetical protein